MHNTYQYYDHKGRRLAIFCRFISSVEAEIVVFTCSKQDQFNKKFAKNEYFNFIEGNKIESHPQKHIATILPEERELQTLLRFCKENYYFWIIAPVEIEERFLVSAFELLEQIN